MAAGAFSDVDDALDVGDPQPSRIESQLWVYGGAASGEKHCEFNNSGVFAVFPY